MPSDIIPVGTKVGPYQIVEQLPEGKGGMARVYVAVCERGEAEQAKVALKVATIVDDPGGSDSSGQFYMEALNNEVETLKSIRHPNIVRIYPIPWYDDPSRSKPYIARANSLKGNPWFCAMEYLEGGTLEQLIRREKRLDVDLAVEIACQIGTALEYLHLKNIAHLDLKPDNVLFRAPLQPGAKPQPVLIDFGIARRTNRSGMDAGSLPYMAPERVRLAMGELAPEQRIDQRPVDVYSLGILLYRMLTGQLPFQGTTRSSITSAVLNSTPTRPSQHNAAIPPELEDVIMRALEKDPRRRPLISEMLQLLDAAVTPRRFALPGPDRPVERASTPGRIKWPYAVFLILAVLLGFGVAALLGLRPGGGAESTPTAIAAATPTFRAGTPTPSPMPVIATVATATSTPSVAPTSTAATATLARSTPTAVPTRTPTARGNNPMPIPETHTPAPTSTIGGYRTPQLLAPANEASFTAWNAKVLLEWSSVGRLGANDYYVVRIPYKGGTAEFWRKVTSFQVPGHFTEAQYLPEGHKYRWTVQVMRCTQNCSKAADDSATKAGFAMSRRSAERTFIWNP